MRRPRVYAAYAKNKEVFKQCRRQGTSTFYSLPVLGRSCAIQTPSRKFYSDALGLPFKEDANGYLHTGELDGVKHFALWPLSQAAESCFGANQWPGNIPVPQAWIEFDVTDVEKAPIELQSRGYQLLVAIRKEPWGQVVTRLLGPEGLLVGITHTASMRK